VREVALGLRAHAERGRQLASRLGEASKVRSNVVAHPDFGLRHAIVEVLDHSAGSSNDVVGPEPEVELLVEDGCREYFSVCSRDMACQTEPIPWVFYPCFMIKQSASVATQTCTALEAKEHLVVEGTCDQPAAQRVVVASTLKEPEVEADSLV